MGADVSSNYEDSKAKFYKAHPFYSKNEDKETIARLQEEIALHLEAKILLITEEQNVSKWFVSRMFCLTSSPAGQYMSIGLQDKNNEREREWIGVSSYALNDDNIQSTTSISQTYQHESNDATEWAESLFTDIDGLSWMQNLSNMNQLMSEARGDREKMARWRALQKAFQIVNVYFQSDERYISKLYNYKVILFIGNKHRRHENTN